MQSEQQLFETYVEQLKDEVQAMHAVAMLLKIRGQEEAAFLWLSNAAQRGYATAEYELGNFYYAGVGVEGNIEQAFYYYERAAMQGHPDAMNNLADMYLNGESTEVDLEQALSWFQQAAQHDVVEAMFTLGLMYEQGLGTEIDVKQAYHFYEQAATNGYDDGQYRLGMIHLQGLLGQTVNDAIAIHWFERAAEQLHIDATFNLGYLFEQAGKGNEAIKYYKQAALLGDYQAKCNLANLYMTDLVIEKNEIEAFKWRKEAQKQLDEADLLD